MMLGWVFLGDSGVPHPGAAMIPPFCHPDLYLLGFIGVNYCCGWGRVAESVAWDPGPGGGSLRVRMGLKAWRVGTRSLGGTGWTRKPPPATRATFLALNLGEWVFNPFSQTCFD